jgi:hypothetical protein
MQVTRIEVKDGPAAGRYTGAPPFPSLVLCVFFGRSRRRRCVGVRARVRARGCAWWVLPALADGGVHVAFADRTMLTLPRWAPLLCDRRPRTLVHLRPRRPELCPRARALVT